MKYLFFLLTVTMIISCSKEGPAGPQGAAGIQGPQGTPGQQGNPGPVGTANVIYSDWLSYDLKAGIYYALYYARIDAPKITQAILDKGDIKIYVSSSGQVWPLPYPQMPDFSYRFSIGVIDLFSPIDWDTYSGYKIRYILIPGSVHAKGSATVDWNDYDAVKRRYNIPD